MHPTGLEGIPQGATRLAVAREVLRVHLNKANGLAVSEFPLLVCI